jgi:hypothetical protein
VFPAGPLADAATDVPGVKLLGVVLGGLLLIAAIRAMFGGGKGGRKGKR